MSVLGDVLTSMRVESALFAHLRFRAPWGVAFAAGDQARLLVVAKGGGWLHADSLPAPVRIQEGDCLIIKPEGRFTLVSDGGAAIVPCERVFSAISGSTHEYGEAGDVSEFISGRLTFDEDAAQPLLSLLADVSHVRLARADAELLQRTLELVGMETRRDGVGAGVVASHLISVLFIQALRAWCDMEAADGAGWLGASRDPRLARALNALHLDIARPWTMAQLAKEAGLSRTAFAALFKTVIGETPLAYVRRWRIYRAKILLKQGLTIPDVARSVGYETDAALNRAFKRTEGMGPGRWRRRSPMTEQPPPSI